MKVLLVRHDADGASWQEYHDILEDWGDWHQLCDTMKAHLNTTGVTRLEILPEG